jgi:hypothetical protein
MWLGCHPDVPGCHGGGPTPEAALAGAISLKNVIRGKAAEFDAAAGEAELDRGRPVKANGRVDVELDVARAGGGGAILAG